MKNRLKNHITMAQKSTSIQNWLNENKLLILFQHEVTCPLWCPGKKIKIIALIQFEKMRISASNPEMSVKQTDRAWFGGKETMCPTTIEPVLQWPGTAATEPTNCNYLSPSATREATTISPTRELPLVPETKEKPMQQQRPSTAKNKFF